MVKLNPYAMTQRRRTILANEKSKQSRRIKVQRKRAGDKFLEEILLAPQAILVEEEKVVENFEIMENVPTPTVVAVGSS